MSAPDMSHDRSEKEIFFAALEQPSADARAIFLEGACGKNPALRRRIEQLLAEHFERDEFMHSAAVEGVPTLVEIVPVTEGPGSQVDRYKLLEKVGEGGCGVVYVAEQTVPVRRRVALKVIKLGMDTKSVVARFEAERQALAMMDHPNIARVLDAGTTQTGRPYFVMELVRGIKITDYCDQEKISTKERLALFIKVCQAIQHAHQKGIIHRDIKPSNILVTLHDGVPVPKVIDFGIAKATEGRLTNATVYTHLNQFIGTPAYMSPEQAEMSGLDVDTRSDIYSLGVLLYELLTGRTPFDGRELMSMGLDAMRKTIREEEPARPSTKLATLQGDELTTTAKRRSADTSRLLHQLKGDLDWIVMKCLEKDRNRRYDTANGLAMDLNRHLSNAPVVARPPSAAYRFQKAWRRNKFAFAAGATVAVTLFAGIVMTTWQAVRATRAEKSVSEEAKRASRLLYVAHMNLAQAAWENSRVGAVLDLLKQHEPRPGEEDLRGFEWHYWDRLCHSSLLDLKGHSGPVTSVAFSPDGKRLASASRDPFIIPSAPGEVKVWDARTGEVLLNLKGHTAPVNCVAYSPDGKRLASASGSPPVNNMLGEVKVWDATTGKVLLTLPGHGRGVASVAFSPDGKRLVSASDGFAIVVHNPDAIPLVSANGGFELKVWDATTGEMLRVLEAHGSGILSVAFSPDGKRLASASRDQTVRVWDATTGERLLTLKGHIGSVTSVVFSPDGKRLTSGSDDRTVKVWDATTGEVLLTLKGHTDGVRTTAFCADGKRLTSASEDQTVKVWDATSGEALLTLKGHAGSVTSVAFSADGNRLASGSDDRTVKVWDTASSQEPRTLNAHTEFVLSVALSPDGKRLASGSYDQTVKMWDAASGQVTFALKGHTEAIMSVALSPDGKRLATASIDKTVKVWDAVTGQETLTLKGHASFVWCVTFSSDDKRLASASSDGTVKVWDATTGQEILTLRGHLQPVRSVAFSPDGKWLASASHELNMRGEVKVWDATSGQEKLTLNGHAGEVWSVAFSPDGKRLATAGEDHTVKVWDAASGQETFTLKGHTGEVKSVAFSPDGKRLASASDDKTVKVWDATSGQETLTLKGHTGLVNSVAFSADGQRLASASQDQTVKVWDASPRSQDSIQ